MVTITVWIQLEHRAWDVRPVAADRPHAVGRHGGTSSVRRRLELLRIAARRGRVRRSLPLLTILLLCGGAAGAATDREALQSQVAKVAPAADAKPKGLCACSFDSGAGFANRVGYIQQYVQSNQVFVRCTGASFGAAGEDTGGTFTCNDSYPLVR